MTEVVQLLPWVVLAILLLADKASEWRLIGVLSRLAERQPEPVVATPAAPSAAIPAKPVLAPPVAPAAPAPAPPVATGPFAAAPPWFGWALHEVGFHETGNNQGIERYIGLAHAGSLGDPWCAIFANAAMESVGIPGSRSASSQSFRTHPAFVKLDGPALGAIAVFWRGTRESGLGHVGFYRGESADRVWTLGGNESDMVEIAALTKNGSSFGLIGYWWPKGVALPTAGAILMPAGSPTEMRTPPASTPAPAAIPNAIQKAITATMFGGQQSAYGGAIDDNAPGVALPFHFPGTRPKVRVTNPKTGATVDCAIIDVGPWMTDDRYWETGARPIAETCNQNQTPLPSGPNQGKIPSNKAGIDLTFAAAKAVAIDGKGLVDWEFITGSPTVT